MNTHFGFGDKGQTDSSKLIYDYSKQFGEMPVFILGDFNMTPESQGYAEMIKNFDDVNAKTSNDLRSTYHGYKPEKIKDQHIDYCFINKNVVPLNQKILDQKVDGKFPSDHYGLYISLNV